MRETREGIVLSPEERKRQRQRSVALAIALAALVAVFYMVTIAKQGAIFGTGP